MIVIFFIVLSLLKINSFHIFNEALVFSSSTNYLLIFSSIIFKYYFENNLFSIISIFLLIVFTILLIYDLKKVLGYIPISAAIYMIFNIYLFISCL